MTEDRLLPVADITINRIKYDASGVKVRWDTPKPPRGHDLTVTFTGLPKEAREALVMMAPYAGKTTVEWDDDGNKVMLTEGWVTIHHDAAKSVSIKGKFDEFSRLRRTAADPPPSAAQAPG